MNRIEQYKQLILGVTSENKVSALLGEIEHHSTIDEVLEFAEWLESGISETPWKEVEGYWLQAFREKFSKLDNNARRDWITEWHKDSFHYFKSIGSEHRVLLVCFSGRFGWMFLPNWLLLSYLPARVTDVLLIQSKKPYLEEDFVRFKSIWTNIDIEVRNIVNDGEISEVRVLGVSGGCVGASLFAGSHSVDSLTIIGAPFLSEEELYSLDRQATDMLKHRTFTKTLRATFICGISDLKAVAQIPRFLRLFPKRKLRVVPGTGHNVFIDMYNQGKLSKAMSWIL